MNEIEINYKTIEQLKPVYSFSRYEVIRPEIEINRSLHDVETFMIRGKDEEIVYVYCYFTINTITKIKWIRNGKMDAETASLIYREFEKNYLKKKFKIELKEN